MIYGPFELKYVRDSERTAEYTRSPILIQVLQKSPNSAYRGFGDISKKGYGCK